MSFLGGFKTFFEKVVAEFEKLFKTASWEQTAQSVITYAAPLVENLIGLVAGGPAEALVTGVVNIIKSDLATLSAVVTGASAALPAAATDIQVAEAALTSIQNNLSAILQSAEVKSAATAAKVTSVVNTILGEVQALLGSISTAANHAPATAAPKS